MSIKDDSTHSSDSSGSGHDMMKSIMINRKPMGKSKTDFVAMSPGANKMSQQQHGRTRNRYVDLNKEQNSDSSASLSNTSLASSISRFRYDFEDLKCKMRIFGESLNLCRCIASDFESKLSRMEKRLQHLEKRQRKQKTECDYSAIIRKNKELSTRTMHDAKKLQMCGTEEQMREVAAKICRNYLHGAWKSVDTADLDFKRISGGLSNFLYYVALPDGAAKPRPAREPCDDDASTAALERTRSNSWTGDEPRKVLLRIYGQVHGERAMDAIVTESVIFTLLSERRLGPKLHGVFSGGRIEEYIPARPLLTKELAEPALSMKIAEKMAAIHSMEVPLSKEPSWLWKTMTKWNKTIVQERTISSVAGKSDEEVKCIKRLNSIDFEKEIEWAKKFIATVPSPAVFCHNDMQEGNILMLEDIPALDEDHDMLYNTQSFTGTASFTGRDVLEHRSDLDHQFEENTRDSLSSHISDSGEPRLVLIDFEYCAYNYRGFDIANHFQEWGYDYTNPEHPFYFENQENCPNLEQKEIFIRQYLKHYHSNVSDNKGAEPSIDDVNHLLDEVEVFAAVSHLLWGMWSIVNAGKSQIPFGYWEYGMSRFDTYLRLKQEVMKKDKLGSQKRKICEVDI